jgi:hypothetical protein
MIDDDTTAAANAGFRKRITMRNNGLMRAAFQRASTLRLIRPSDPLARRPTYAAVKKPIIPTSRNRRYLI